MKFAFKPLLISTVLAAASLGAMAQSSTTPSPPPGGPMGHQMRHDPAKMQERIAQRQAALKAKLNLSAGQEAAWNAYVAAMQPPAGQGPRPTPEARKKMHEEFKAMTTPQRIDRMNEMKARRDAEMARRGDAVKTFYAALTPEQQKIFDAQAMPHGGGPGRMGHGGPRQG